MGELWILIWFVTVSCCSGTSVPFCKSDYIESYDYSVFQSSAAVLEKYNMLMSMNRGEPLSYKLFKISDEWLIAPKPSTVPYEIKVLQRK